jgi:hypothetical protein
MLLRLGRKLLLSAPTFLRIEVTDTGLQDQQGIHGLGPGTKDCRLPLLERLAFLRSKALDWGTSRCVQAGWEVVTG